jgi:hypothetical protein
MSSRTVTQMNKIVWMLEGKMEFRLGNEQRVCGRGDVVVVPGGTRARGMVPRKHRGDRFLRAPAGRLLGGKPAYMSEG